MFYGNIACFDVYYYKEHARAARACCVVFEVVPCERVISGYCTAVETVGEYIPGEFYKRELPCLLQVYEKVAEKIDLIIVDSFVMLGNGKKGLGGHLFTALHKKIPVIGVAKSFFKGCRDYVRLYRGKSSRPLYVSSIGIDLNMSAELIKNLAGGNRIPEMLKRVDRLTRSSPEKA